MAPNYIEVILYISTQAKHSACEYYTLFYSIYSVGICTCNTIASISLQSGVIKMVLELCQKYIEQVSKPNHLIY